MSGFTLLKKIRSNPKLATIPVILLTALDDLRDRIQGYDLMADLYLTKPIDTTELLSMVKSLTRLHQSRGKSTQVSESPGAGITEDDQNFLSNLLAKIHESINDPDFTVDHLAKSLFMSRRKLERRLISAEGITPKEYIRQIRLEKAKELIETGVPSSLTDLAARVGYKDGAHFAQVYRKFYGKSIKLKNSLG
jgi:transcriptional regulator GlxA family with amidase domain